MNIEQVNEALAKWHWWMRSFSELQLIDDAARRFVDGWETCPTCHGSGQRDSALLRLAQMPTACPDCVDGMTPGPELVERCAEAARRVVQGPKFATFPAAAKTVLLASRREEQ